MPPKTAEAKGAPQGGAHKATTPSLQLPALPADSAGDDSDRVAVPDLPGHASALAPYLTRLGDMAEDDEGGDDDEFGDLQVALTRVIKAKAAKQQQKQAAVLSELQAHVTREAKSLEAAVNKEVKDTAGLASATFVGLQKKLADKFKAIEAMNEAYQQSLHVAWEDYNAIYGQLDEARDKVLAAADKRRGALKRKLAALGKASQERIADADRKLAKIGQQKAKLPNIASMLESLMG